MTRHRPSQQDLDELLSRLLEAAAGRHWSENVEGWTYGWFDPGYRRSPNAAINVPGGSVGLAAQALAAYESAMDLLLRQPAVARWDSDDLWGIVAERVATLPRDEGAEELRRILQDSVARILSSVDTLVSFPVANVAWSGPPLCVGNSAIGVADERFAGLVVSGAHGRPTLPESPAPWWLSATGTASGADVVVYAAWVPARGSRALELAKAAFDDLVAVALLLEPSPDALSLWSGRGDSHRPGVRGLRLDRAALRSGLPAELSKELSAEILVADAIGAHVVHRWHGEHPFPLDRLLGSDRLGIVDQILALTHNALHRRLRVAARWHARAHWSAGGPDAVLALGVALDALLSGKGPGPGSVLAEHFALLEPDVHLRASMAKRMQQIYEARSAVAHGGMSREADQPFFARHLAADVRLTARRLINLQGETPVESEQDLVDAFDALKWGTRTTGLPGRREPAAGPRL